VLALCLGGGQISGGDFVQIGQNGVIDGFSLAAFVSGAYSTGLEQFKTTPQPLPLETLWAGQCFFALDQNVQALECFWQAQSAGLEDGAVFAATVLRFGSDLSQAQAVLGAVRHELLSGFGLAAWHREHGLQLLATNKLAQAVAALETAWRLAAADQIGRLLLGRFSQSLGLALLEAGRSESAVLYLNRALETAQPETAQQLLLVRATALAYLGRLEAATADLQAVTGTSAFVMAHMGLVRGFLWRLQGLLAQSRAEYAAVAENAKQLGWLETEWYARLGLVGAAENAAAAQVHLARMRALQQTEIQEATLGWRHGAWLVQAGNLDGLLVLEEAALGFLNAELERDAGLVQLHLAEAQLLAGNVVAARLALARAVNARHASANGTLFALELRQLSRVRGLLCLEPARSGLRVLLSDFEALERLSAPEIRIFTIGEYGLSLQGQRIVPTGGTQKTLLLLVYLLEFGASPLEQICLALYPEEPQTVAKSRFQTLRNSLHKNVPGLLIGFDAATKHYSLESEKLRLVYDAAQLRDALATKTAQGLATAMDLYGGEYLPKTDLEWAVQKRFDLELDFAQSGIEVLQDLLQQGKPSLCLNLAERLCLVAPLDLAVHLLLLKATARAKGLMAAKDRLGRVDTALRHDLERHPEVRAELQAVWN
jgi:hypothetical protein